MYVCVRESVCVCERVCVRKRERERVCVREREREKNFVMTDMAVLAAVTRSLEVNAPSLPLMNPGSSSILFENVD